MDPAPTAVAFPAPFLSAPEPVWVEVSRGRRYPVHVGWSFLEGALPGLLRAWAEGEGRVLGPATRCAVVTDEGVGPRHGPALGRALAAAGLAPVVLTVPAGEPSKSLARVEELCGGFAAHRLDRNSFVVALGGGVVGDLAGFAAAVYHRGIACVQVPTTVTAQVDSAVGGKTGVNLRAGKNLVGAFHPPAFVCADAALLGTLPGPVFREGCAEVIKHAAIRDAALFARLETEVRPDFAANAPEAVLATVRRNVEIKARIVSEDEFERPGGPRSLLNFGHTVGHGIEGAAGYGGLFHGEAVSVGMAAAAWLSVVKGVLPAADAARLTGLLTRFGLPRRWCPPELPAADRETAVLGHLRGDKKFRDGQIRFVLLRRVGEAFVSAPGEVTWEEVAAAVRAVTTDPA